MTPGGRGGKGGHEGELRTKWRTKASIVSASIRTVIRVAVRDIPAAVGSDSGAVSESPAAASKVNAVTVMRAR